MPGTVLERLRNETADYHRKIESELDLFSRVRGEESYASLLRDFVSFYSPLEEKMRKLDSNVLKDFHVETRFKTHLLEADLGQVEGFIETRRDAKNDELPDISDVQRFLGCLYVLEGSTLGSQVIRKHLAEKVGLRDQILSFHTGYGERTGKMWQDFRAALLKYAELHPSHSDTIIASACETFDKLGSWLSRNHSSRFHANQIVG